MFADYLCTGQGLIVCYKSHSISCTTSITSWSDQQPRPPLGRIQRITAGDGRANESHPAHVQHEQQQRATEKGALARDGPEYITLTVPQIYQIYTDHVQIVLPSAEAIFTRPLQLLAKNVDTESPTDSAANEDGVFTAFHQPRPPALRLLSRSGYAHACS